MDIIVLDSLVVAGFATIAFFLIQMHKALRQTLQGAQPSASQQAEPTTALQHQVDEIHQTMGGVIQTLKAMGHQVHNLNTLAGYALKEVQAHEQNPMTRVMMELQSQDESEEGGGRQMVSFDEMPEEVQEKVRAFQAVYKAIVASKEGLPSWQHPDWN